MSPASRLCTQSSAFRTSSPASQLLQSAAATAHSPFPLPTPLSKTLGIIDDTLVPITDFTPDGQFPISESLSIQNSALNTLPLSALSTGSASLTSSPNSSDAPLPARVPPTSVGCVDANPSQSIAIAPNLNVRNSEAHEMGGKMVVRGEASGGNPLEHCSHEMGARKSTSVGKSAASHSSPSTWTPGGALATDDTLQNLLCSELTLSKTLATIDPLSAAFMQTLQNLATLRYHITAKRADLAAAQDPKHLNALAKATAIIQRDHHRLAREAAAKEREHNRRQREQAQDVRYKQRQQDAELKYKRKLELATLAIEKQDKKSQHNADNRKNHQYKHPQPNPHNQPKKHSTSSLSHGVTPSLPATAPTTQPAARSS